MPSITTNSFKEEYGRVGPEAMGAGCLVISSNSGTLPELMRDSEWVFPEGDIDALSNLLLKAIYLDNREEVAKKNSAYAHKDLSLTKQADLMNKIF